MYARIGRKARRRCEGRIAKGEILIKPPVFDYEAPRHLDEVLSLLAQYGDEAKILAGGQSLVPMLNMRLARPGVLIDINRIPDLSYISLDGDRLRIGATTRQAMVERSSDVRDAQPLLSAAIRHIGYVPIRRRGTVGGSLAHADPAAELGAVWTCLDGTLHLRSQDGARDVPADEFFQFYYTTDINPDEMLVEASVPVLSENAGWSFQEMARRPGDFALVAVACTVTLDDRGVFEDVRLALTGVGPTPLRLRELEASLQGQRPSPDVFAEAAAAASRTVEPEGDVHASAEYRRHLSGVLVRRALEEAVSRAGQSGGERS